MSRQGYWEVNVTNATLGSSLLFKNAAIAFDSGLTFIAMPASDAKYIANLVGATELQSDMSTIGQYTPSFSVYRLNTCDYNTIKNLPVLSIVISGTNFTLTGSFTISDVFHF